MVVKKNKSRSKKKLSPRNVLRRYKKKGGKREKKNNTLKKPIKKVPERFGQKTGLSEKLIKKIWKFTNTNREECYHLLKVILEIKETYPRTRDEYIASVLLDVLETNKEIFNPILNHSNTKKYIEEVNRILYGIRHTPLDFTPIKYLNKI